MGKTHIQRKLEKIQQHGIPYRVFDLEGNVGRQTRRFRFEGDVYLALLENPAAAEEVIELTESALQYKKKTDTQLSQVLLKKIFAKDVLRKSAQAEFELYYESDFFRMLSSETISYAMESFMIDKSTRGREHYMPAIIQTVVDHLKANNILGETIQPTTNRPDRYPKENFINDCNDIDTNMLKTLMEEIIILREQEDSEIPGGNTDLYMKMLEVELYIYLLSNTPYFTFDLQKAIDSFSWEKYNEMIKNHEMEQHMYVYIGDDWENAYSKRSIL